MLRRNRAGVTLAELLVATVIGGMLCAAASGALVHLRRASTVMLDRELGFRRGAEAIAMLEAIGQHLRYLTVRGDTAVQGELRIAVGVACQVDDSTITLAPARPGGPEALTFLTDLPESGDRVELLSSAVEASVPTWLGLPVTRAVSLSARDGCAPDSPYVMDAERRESALRLTVPPRRPSWDVGSPVEVYREIRLVVYESGNREWTLGMRRCSGDRCASVQPMIGPVQAPDAGGMRFVAEAGHIVAVQLRVPMLDRVFEGVMGALVADR